MEGSQDRCDVMSSVKTGKKPSCCVLDKLEATEELCRDTSEEGVAVIKTGED